MVLRRGLIHGALYRFLVHRMASRVSMDVTLLPRITTVPSGAFWAGTLSSWASSRTRLRKMSKPRSVPLTFRPPWM